MSKAEEHDIPTDPDLRADVEDTQVNFPLFADEYHDPPTERIPIPEHEVPTSYAPAYIAPPPPPPLYRPPVDVAPAGHLDPSLNRGRGFTAFLVLAALVLGAFGGFFFASATAVQQLNNTPPQVEISTKTATATATATRTKTKRVTMTPKPAPTVTKTPKQQDEKQGTPQSCFTAMNIADQYLNLVRRSGGSSKGRANRVLEGLREDYWYWSAQCRDDS